MVDSAPTTQQRVGPIPIGNDHLMFKHDSAIMNELEPNGKFLTSGQRLLE